MTALELLKSDEPLLLEETPNKKIKTLSSTFNQCMKEMNAQIQAFEAFAQSGKSGEMFQKITMAKSLAEFFAGNKLLKANLAVTGLENEEKAKINAYFSAKTKLLDTLKAIIKESSKEAFVSNYDIFDDNLVKCEKGHEVLILGDRNQNILLNILNQLTSSLHVEGNFENIRPQSVNVNLDTLNRNVALCNQQNEELNGAKHGKLAKVKTFIAKLEEVGEQVVAFYTYKDTLLNIGCDPKGVKGYENVLIKSYVPLKNTLNKELRIDLEDICNITVNEAEFPTLDVEEHSPSTQEFENVFAEETETANVTENANQLSQPTVEENPDDPFVDLNTPADTNFPVDEEPQDNPFDKVFVPKSTPANPNTPNFHSPLAHTPLTDDDYRN